MIALWLLFLVSCTAGEHPKQPNIVMILADDMGYQDVGFRGSNILTPNIDKLAKEGVILENHYTMPLCSPTRSSLMSGRHAIRTGFWRGNIAPREEWGLRLNETTLPEMLRRNGYATHGIGKWHCGMYTWQHTPAQRGFDTFFGLFLGEQTYFTHRNRDILDFREDFFDADGKFVDNIRADLDGQYSTFLFTQRAIKDIKRHDQSKPLFLYLAYTAPHRPHEAPNTAIKKFASHIPDIPEGRKAYATQISTMDEGIGKVVGALKLRSMLDNTILVFSSDNGAVIQKPRSPGSNYPLRGGKCSLFEGGVRAASFVNSPLLQKTGYTNTNLHHVTDWYATFQKMAGDQPENHSKPQLPIDGVDIWRSISNNETCRDEVLINYIVHTMIQNSVDHEFLVKRKENYDDLKLTKSDDEVEEHLYRNSRDVFVIRWRKWKLFIGNYTVLGWSNKNSIYPAAKNFSQSSYHESGILLFDLLVDPREEHNIADIHPYVVNTILDKIPEYKKKMTPTYHRRQSKAGMIFGEWKPWVELELLS